MNDHEKLTKLKERAQKARKDIENDAVTEGDAFFEQLLSENRLLQGLDSNTAHADELAIPQSNEWDPTQKH